MRPDPWQSQLLRSPSKQLLLCCSRQAGKSQGAAAMALSHALVRPNSLILIFSRTIRQAGEVFVAKLLPLYHAWEAVVPRSGPPNRLNMTLANGSRIICLPATEAGVVGYSKVDLLIIDEASRVPDTLYHSVRPMLAVSRGKLAVLSTPLGKRGWFYEEWEKGQGWERVKIEATQVPRIDTTWLASERTMIGDRWYMQEYCCSFEATIDAVFTEAQIQAALDADVEPITFFRRPE